ncbi:hypothetical protein E2K98_29765 [Bacillus salipaludis]|uniref:CBO0543 family protein n=1 Tax=Bacillus salipaludis TaxID=2547811 RepID=A0A4R5VJ70_9BACI|nr:CBO0543 family protein [Bacillus salipaludis]MDQ6596402.1 CBO0543 family protein [Bacillus salipaludis]TDK54062.1 hypothetical protein E2K98_29765 [Bacillus salipaludis]
MTDRKILKFLWLLGLVLLFPTLLKKPIKEQLIIFLLSSFFNTPLDNYLVSKDRLEYPVRLKNERKFTKGSFLYDSILCPLITVWYYQSTQKTKKLSEIILKTFLFTTPQVILEALMERFTRTINYKKGWKWYHSFIGIFLLKLYIRGFVGLINLISYAQHSSEKAKGTH